MAAKDDSASTLKKIDELIASYTKDYGPDYKDVRALADARAKLVAEGERGVKEVNKVVDGIKQRNDDLTEILEPYLPGEDDEGIPGATASTQGSIRGLLANQFKTAKNFMENISQAISKESIEDITGKKGSGIGDILKDTGTAVALGRLSRGFEGLARQEEKLTGNLQVYRKLAMEVSDINIFTAFDKDKDTEKDMIELRSKSIKKVRDDVVALQNAIPGISAEAARTAIASISQQSKTLNQIIQNVGTDAFERSKDLFAGFGKGAEDVRKKLTAPGAVEMSGSAALIATIKGLGLDVSKTLPLVDKMMTELGTGTSDILPRLTAFGIAAKGSGLATDDFVDSVGAMASQFTFLGDQTIAVSAGLKNFINGFQNTGQIKLAKQTYEALTKSVADMGDEMKAFLSISTGLGKGAGAIPGIVDLEEALASGDQSKINEVIKAAMSQVEQISGGPLLTRKEAVQTGQQERYFIQAEIAKQLLPNITNRGMFDVAVKGLRQGETITPAMLEEQSRNSANLAAIMDTGAQAQQTSLSFSEMAANALGTLRDNLSADGFGVYLKATDTMQKAISDALPGLAGKDFGEIFKIFTGMAEKPSPEGPEIAGGQEGAAYFDFSQYSRGAEMGAAFERIRTSDIPLTGIMDVASQAAAAPGAALLDFAANTTERLNPAFLDILSRTRKSYDDNLLQSPTDQLPTPPGAMSAPMSFEVEPLRLTIGIDLDSAAQGMFKLKETNFDVKAAVRAAAGQQ